MSKLQETVKDREAWCAAVHRAGKSFHDWATEQQQLYLKKALKKKIKKAFSERASLVAQTGKDPSCNVETQVWSLDWEDPLEREWRPALVFLPGESHEQRRLMGFSPWGHKESDMTD